MEIIKIDTKATVCTIKNEKGEICSGHLKQWLDAPNDVRKQVPKGYQLYRCKRCRAAYMGPLHEHLIAAKGGQVLNPQTDEEPEVIA